MARGRMKRVERHAAARGHEIVWDFVEDVRVHVTCSRCGRKVRISRPYGEAASVGGDAIEHDCDLDEEKDREA